MVKRIKNFFLTCSGADRTILDLPECHIEHNKYVGIGGTVFFTAVLASISGSYALFKVFENPLPAICFGLLWGAVIFNLDRYIVSTMRKKKVASASSWWERLSATGLPGALPRFALAIFISVIITKPIELRMFQKEINAQVEKTKSAALAEIEQLKRREFPEIEDLDTQNEQLRQEVRTKETQRDDLREVRNQEARGVRGPRTSGTPGWGPLSEKREQDFQKLEAELESLRLNNQGSIADNNKRIGEKKAELDIALKKAREEIEAGGGLLASLKTLGELNQNPTVAAASTFLFLLFVLLETTPVIAKLLSERGMYDEIYERMEHEVYMRERDQITQSNDDSDIEIALSRKAKEDRLKAEAHLSESTMSSIGSLAPTELKKAKAEIARHFVSRWRERELNNLKAYYPKIIPRENGAANEDVSSFVEIT